MDTLYTFWDNITHYKTESVHFWGLMNSATNEGVLLGCAVRNLKLAIPSGQESV